MTVGTLGEFGLISRITARLGTSPGVLLGPGDDAAIVAVHDAGVLASTDVLVEGRHFRRDWADGYQIGRRAAAANLADIMAMGGHATALLVALCCPPDLDVPWVEHLADGLTAEAALAGAVVVGGDISASPVLTIAVTALGDLRGGKPVLRSGARPGDVVAVAGRIGYAAAGLTILSRGFRSPQLLVEAYRQPTVPYPAGPQASRLGATAMLDISDGLLADLGHIAQSSAVAINVYRDKLDVPDTMVDAAKALGVDSYNWVLTGGDDHALAATFPPYTQLSPDWRVIGKVDHGTGVTVDGREYKGAKGWDHFR